MSLNVYRLISGLILSVVFSHAIAWAGAPNIVLQPLSHFVPEGGSATLSVTVTNTATLPVTNRWRRVTAGVVNVMTNVNFRTTDYFTITNVQGSNRFNVAVSNPANPAGFLSSTVFVAAVPDSDGDGMPDAWETTYGLDPNNPVDAALDSDYDGMSNRDEYVAGTLPNNTASRLALDIANAGTLSWTAASNRIYEVQYKDSMDDAAWLVLITVPARSTNRVETVVDLATARPRRFYRVAARIGLTSAYSVNVVGFINQTVPPGLSLISNLLNNGDNKISRVIPNAPDTAEVVKNGESNFFSGGWSNPNMVLRPGESFHYRNPLATNVVLTFVGDVPLAPAVITPPAGQTVRAGTLVNLIVQANGLPPLAYQWRLNGTNLPGASNNVLTIANAQPQHSGNYMAVVTNIYGSVTSVVALAVAPVLYITRSGGQLAVTWSGAGFRLQGTTELAGAWTAWTDTAGSAPYTFVPIGHMYFRLVGGSSAGQIYSANMVGYVNTSIRQGWNAIANPFHFSSGNFLYEVLPWVPDETELWKIGPNGLECSYYIDGFGWIECAPENGPMSLSPGEGAMLNSPSATTITWIGDVQQGNLLNKLPGGLSFGSSIVPEDRPLTGAFSHDFPAETGDTVYQFNSANQSYVAYTFLGNEDWDPFPPVVIPGEGFWMELARNKDWARLFTADGGGFGGAYAVTNFPFSGTAPFPVPGKVPPAIIDQPLSQTNVVGTNVSFSVTTTGSPPLQYQWYFWDSALGGKTNGTLTLSNVQPANAGEYRVIVTNAYGRATSVVARLTVRAPLTPPVLHIAASGAQVQLSWYAPPGYGFWVESKNSLSDSAWAVLSGTVASTGGTNIVIVPTGPAPSRFFRLVSGDVYSANVVGYVNVPLRQGWNAIANPLQFSSGNFLNEVLSWVPDESELWKIGPNGLEGSLYVDGFGWDEYYSDGPMSLSPGEGAMLYATAPTTIRWIGDVQQGNLLSKLPAGLSLGSSIVPEARPLTGVSSHGFPAGRGDVIYKFDSVSQSYFGYTYLGGDSWVPENPLISPGEAFWTELGRAKDWTRSFSVDGVGVGAYAITNFPLVGDAPFPIPGAPRILSMLDDRAGFEGTNVTFTVIAVGHFPLAYQWFFNETNLLAGATNSWVTRSNISFADAGTYRVVIQNSLGSTSAVARLTVLPTPRLLLATDATIGEGTIGLGTVSRNFQAAGNVVILLSTSDPNEVRVPSSVTVGNGPVSFPIEVIENTFVQGPRRVLVFASAAGYLSGSNSFAIADNDVPALTLAFTRGTISEGDGPFASQGTVSRTPASAQPLVVELTSSDTSELVVPPMVVISAGQASANFTVGAVDDDAMDGSHTVVVKAWATATLSGERVGPGAARILLVTDDEQPVLRLALQRESLLEGSNTIGTVTRTNNIGTDLTVTLISSDSSEITLPASVTITNGQTNVSFTIRALEDGVVDGNQTVSITATASGFEPSTKTIVVTDLLLPDLVPGGIELPSAAEPGARVTVRYNILNRGVGPVNGNYVMRLYFSRDPFAGDDLFADQVNGPVPLAVGSQADQTLSIPGPQEPGDYWLIVVADADDTLRETVEHNNYAVSQNFVHVEPPYTATVTSEFDVLPSGTPVPLYGQTIFTDSTPARLKPVVVHIFSRGTRRVLSTWSDANGDFTVTFYPLPGEAGHYQAIAVPPGIDVPYPDDPAGGGIMGIAATEAQFDLVSAQFVPATASHVLYGVSSVTNTVTVTNVSQLELAGVSFEVIGAPAHVSVVPQVPNVIPTGGSIPVLYTVEATVEDAWEGDVAISLVNANGQIGLFGMHLRTEPLRPRLVARPSTLHAGMLGGQQAFVEFELHNEGGAETGPLWVALPAGYEWLHLATPAPIPSLARGDATIVTLQLLPPTNIPTGDYNGAVHISGTDTNTQLDVRFSFRALSDARGNIEVETIDEYFYFAVGSPRLAGATVELTDPITGAVATGVTDTNGMLRFSDVREGYYVLEISAPAHSKYINRALLVGPGQTTFVQAFLSRQTVQYIFTVEPILIDDRTLITIHTEFETFVPIPVVVVDPIWIDLSRYTNSPDCTTNQIDIGITNMGLVAARDLAIQFQTHPCWEVTAPGAPNGQLGTLDGRQGLSVPIKVCPLPSYFDTNNFCGPCEFNGVVTWILRLGGQDVTYSQLVYFVNACKAFTTDPPPPCTNCPPPPPPPPCTNCPPPPPPCIDCPPPPPPCLDCPPPPACTNCPPIIYTNYPPPGVGTVIALELDTEAIIARDAFRATLEIRNPLPSPVADISVELQFLERTATLATDRFQIRSTNLVGLSGISSNGLLFPNSTGKVSWIVVPLRDAAPMDITDYYVTGRLRYRQDNNVFDFQFAKAPIRVLPMPLLVADFFHQRDVYSDDPFTPQTEPAQPFSLAVMIQNQGYGVARNMRLTSPKPQIVSNDDGLFINFDIYSAQLGTQAVPPRLTMNFGDILRGQIVLARWTFTSTLQGLFVSYDASFEHLDGLGEERASVFQRVDIHEMTHLVRDDRPGADSLHDFLVNDNWAVDDLPDNLYLSNGQTNPVAVVGNGLFGSAPSAGNLQVRFTNSAPAGWTYFRLKDPSAGQFFLIAVERPDGTRLPVENFWQTDRVFVGGGQRPIQTNLIHFLDFDSPSVYTLYFYQLLDTNAPSSMVGPLPAQSYPGIPVTWSGVDAGGSGIAFNDIYVSVDGGTNALWLARTPEQSAIYQGLPGHAYAFYSIATDYAGNREAPPGVPDAQTRVALANQPPVIAPIGDQTINESSFFTFKVVASDSDRPLQTLTYSLSNAPAGATINAQSGLIAWFTGEAHGDSTNIFTVVVTDSGDPPLSDSETFTLYVLDVNTPPELQPVAPIAINVGESVCITNRASDIDVPPQTLTFGIDPGTTPAGVRINPANGVLCWTPPQGFGSTTNRLLVFVRDNGWGNLAATQEVVIIVNDFLALGLGQAVVRINQSSNLPMSVFSSAGVTNLRFGLGFAADYLTNVILSGLNPIRLITRLEDAPGRVRFDIETIPGNALLGDAEIATMYFRALSNRSDFVKLTLTNIVAVRNDGLIIPTVQPRNGRVVVIGREPLLEARLEDGQRVLYLFGNPGVRYAIEHTGLLGYGWQQTCPPINFSSPDLVEPVCPDLLDSLPTIFLRAREAP